MATEVGYKTAKMVGSQTKCPLVSVVIPAKDEEASIRPLYEGVRRVFDASSRYSLELIFVNDGSIDGTQRVIEELNLGDVRVKGIELKRNFGQSPALAAGLERAAGEIIITMDADLQNDPADIPLFLQKIEEGYDIVSGWRKDRKDKFITRRVPSVIANRLIASLTGVRLHDYGCALKAYRRHVLQGLRLYGDMHRFLPVYASMQGARITEIVTNHYPRKFGSSKYGLSRVFKVILDLVTIQFFQRFLSNPMRIFGGVGALFFVAGLSAAAYLSYIKLILGAEIGSRPLLLLAVLFIVVGIQLVGLGILGELLSRIYFESRDRRPYAVKKLVGRFLE